MVEATDIYIAKSTHAQLLREAVLQEELLALICVRLIIRLLQMHLACSGVLNILKVDTDGWFSSMCVYVIL